MSTPAQSTPPSLKPLRLWPGVVAAALLLLIRYILPLALPDAGLVTVLGGLVLALIIILWWVFFSRAAWLERLCAVALIAIALFATSRLVHKSIAGGMMGMMLVIYAVPVLSLALVAWAATTRSS